MINFISLLLFKNNYNKIIIFAGAIYPANAIYKILQMENINCCLVTGETNLIERRNNIELFKQEKSNMNIIINYGVLTTGFDAPKALHIGKNFGNNLDHDYK